MLIETPVAANDVVSIRLISGEEVVGKVIEVKPTEITITKPFIIQMQMVAPQQVGLAFTPFALAIDETAKYTFSHDKLVLKPLKAAPHIVKAYFKETTQLDIATGLPT